jgi:hypothetical protein
MIHYLLAGITLALVWAWVIAHQLILFYVASVLIEQLPPPDATSGKFYTYAYSVIQIFAANWRRTKDAVKAKP